MSQQLFSSPFFFGGDIVVPYFSEFSGPNCANAKFGEERDQSSEL